MKFADVPAAPTFRQVKDLSGLSLAEFSRRYGIPVRSLENWSAGSRECPLYLVRLLYLAVALDMKEGE